MTSALQEAGVGSLSSLNVCALEFNFGLVTDLLSSLLPHSCFSHQEMMEVSGTLFLLITEANVKSLSCCCELYQPG